MGTPNQKILDGMESETMAWLELTTRRTPNRINFYVKCYFDKSKSWSNNTTSLRLLEHEQLHFDIAEYFARDLRSRLTKLNGTHVNLLEGKARGLYQEVMNDYILLQKQYDMETDHSRNLVNQLKWNQKVAEMLEESKQYSPVVVSIERID